MYDFIAGYFFGLFVAWATEKILDKIWKKKGWNKKATIKDIFIDKKYKKL